MSTDNYLTVYLLKPIHLLHNKSDIIHNVTYKNLNLSIKLWTDIYFLKILLRMNTGKHI